jgi:hypothetical protein
MADIINLRTARKRKARDAKAETAAQNRITFGRTKAEKSLTEAKSELAEKRLDGHKLDD